MEIDGTTINVGVSSGEPAIALRLTATQWVQLLSGDEAKQAQKTLNYWDGYQEEEMETLLSDVHRGRRDWKQRGFIPRFRNVTRMVVERSGMLFKDQAPVLEIFNPGSDVVDSDQTKRLGDELAKCEWQETFAVFDQVVRLMKTGILLVQWSPEEKSLCFDILTRANCQVVADPASRKPMRMIYNTSKSDTFSMYRIFTLDSIIDFSVDKERKATIVAVNPNTYGIVPIAQFYDTLIPRSGFWVHGGQDLVNLNELVNIHITDSEWAISWAKQPTLVSNMKPAEGIAETFESVQLGTTPLPRMVPVDPGIIGGPGKVLYLDSSGVDSPFFEYKTPAVDIQPINDVVAEWIKAVAADWSVRVEGTTPQKATSGFQVLVEEMPNRDLRQMRQRMFENGFKRLYKIIARVLNVATSVSLNEDAELFVAFPEPYLPIDTKEQEDVWTTRISEGRATVVDYFCQVEGMSKEEAESKVEEIVETKAWLAELERKLPAEAPTDPAVPPSEPDEDTEAVA